MAEEKSRKSNEILSRQKANAEIGEANPASFENSFLIAAGWDTLGAILLKENKTEEARDYLEAAWRNRPELEDCLHYGEVLEALGARKEALRIYESGRPHPVPPGSPNPAVKQDDNLDPAAKEMEDKIQRLKAAGVTPNPGSSPQEQRTFKLKVKAASAYWSAMFRLGLSASGKDQAMAEEVMQVSGNEPREEVAEAIKQLPLPHMVPKMFLGLLLRDAVVSCSAGKTECVLVLMPMGGMAAERATQ